MKEAVDLRRRATEPELLDTGVEREEALRSLADLRAVNGWLGCRRSLLGAVRPLLRGVARPRLLDVGCGSADLSEFLLRALPGSPLAVGMDAKRLHVEQAGPGVLRVVADARRLPFPAGSFDVVTASLFLHHFHGPELVGLLGSLYALARRALVVNDLRRGQLPYLFARAVFPRVLRSPVSVADGLVSIRRGFTPEELASAFREARIPGVRVRRAFPYRLLAVAARVPA